MKHGLLREDFGGEGGFLESDAIGPSAIDKASDIDKAQKNGVVGSFATVIGTRRAVGDLAAWEVPLPRRKIGWREVKFAVEPKQSPEMARSAERLRLIALPKLVDVFFDGSAGEDALKGHRFCRSVERADGSVFNVRKRSDREMFASCACWCCGRMLASCALGGESFVGCEKKEMGADATISSPASGEFGGLVGVVLGCAGGDSDFGGCVVAFERLCVGCGARRRDGWVALVGVGALGGGQCVYGGLSGVSAFV